MTKRLPEIRVVGAAPALVVFEFFDGERARRFTMRSEIARKLADEIDDKANEAETKERAT